MGLATRFIPHSAQLNTRAGVTSWINGVSSINPSSGISLFEQSSGSETDRSFVAISGVAPTVPISTTDLTILSTIGMSGLLIRSDTSKPGFIVYGRELPFGALPTAIASTAHIVLTISDGMLIPQSLRAAHNEVARLSLMAYATLGSDGTSGATPFVYTANAAIASGAGQTSHIHTLGPFKYTVSGGSSRLVTGVKEAGVNFGIAVIVEGTDGDVYPTMIAIMSRMPTMEFSTDDAELIAEIGDGISVSAAAQYFKAVDSNGQRIANGTGSHVSVSGTAGVITPGALNLVHKESAFASYTYTPVLNTNIATIAVNATIPTS